MRSLFFAASLFFVAAPASADIIFCNFTEPFFSVAIDTEKKTVVLTEPDWESTSGGTKATELSKNASVVNLPSKHVSSVIEIPRYSIQENGKEILLLELSYLGSDGMSDFAYPYEAFFNGQVGGCESDRLKRHSFVYEEEQK